MATETLLTDVLAYLKQHDWRKASFDRLISNVPGAATFEQLCVLTATNPRIFRGATLKGGMPGLALQDDFEFDNDPAPMTADALNDQPTFGTRAPSVTQEEVDNEIMYVDYLNVGTALRSEAEYHDGRAIIHPALDCMTMCFITLRNGFTITGKSACVSPANYNKAIGEDLAYKDAVKQIWPYLGFRLADWLHLPKSPPVAGNIMHIGVSGPDIPHFPV